MLEYALYGQVSQDDHHRMLQQLAGYTRMQPQDTAEIHLVFKARPPPGLDNIPSAGGSQGVMQPDVQKFKNMLHANLYYVQLVGEVVWTQSLLKAEEDGDTAMTDNGQTVVGTGHSNSSTTHASSLPTVRWALDFKDTPDAGKQAVSTRMVSRTPIDDGDLVKLLDLFGYEYVSRYMITGSKFYDHDTTIFVHKVLTLPQVAAEAALSDRSFLSDVSSLPDLDGSGGYLIQASIEVVDGNNPELKDRATRQLLAHKEALKQAVDLTPGDRLALDTRVPVASRRS